MHLLLESQQVSSWTENKKILCTMPGAAADGSIRHAAMKKMDRRLLTIVSRDVIAVEGHCHRLCYRSYTREEKAASSATRDEDHNDEAQCKTALSHSYNEVFLFIRNEIFSNPQVIAMADLTFKLVTSIKYLVIEQMKDSLKEHLCQRLGSEFGKALEYLPMKKGNFISLLTTSQ